MSKALYGLIRQSKTGTSVVPICNIKSFYSSRALVCCSSDTLIGISPCNNTADIAISAAKNIRRFGIDREPRSLAFPIANLITNFIRICAKASRAISILYPFHSRWRGLARHQDLLPQFTSSMRFNESFSLSHWMESEHSSYMCFYIIQWSCYN